MCFSGLPRLGNTYLLWLEKVLSKIGRRFEMSSSVSDDGSEWVAVIDSECAETILHIAWIDGTVIVAFPTGHAYALRSASGVELLIHIGMDTVKLGGEHFTPRVKKGQQVRRGDVLADVDWAAVAAAGYDLTTPVVVSNAKKLGGVDVEALGAVSAEAPLLRAHPREEALA